MVTSTVWRSIISPITNRTRRSANPPINSLGDGVVDTADMGIMISVFGMNCRGCTVAMAQGTPLSLMVRTGMTLMSELGFTDPDAYREWFNALGDTERQAHLEDAIEIIQLAP